MPKFSNSLRDSIIAEKKSLEESNTADDNQVNVVESPNIESEYKFLDTLKERISAKKLPISLYYEVLLVLLRGNIINKQSENLTNISTQAIEFVKEYMDIPLEGAEHISRLNVETVRRYITETTRNFEDMTAMRKPVGLFACLSHIVIQAVENNKDYCRILTEVIARSQSEVSKVMQTQQSYAVKNLTNMFSGFGLFSAFNNGTNLLQVKS